MQLKRPPLLLYSYLASEMLAPFFASFIIMNCVFFLVKLIPFLDFVLELEISFMDFIRIFSYLFPNIFLYTIPMSAMLGVTIAFSRLSNDNEILAFKAGGISIYQMLPPVIVVTLAMGLLTAYFSIKLIPVSEINMEKFTKQLFKEKVDKGIKEKKFTEALGDIVVYVSKVDKKTNHWREVWVSDMRGQETPTIIMAEQGRMDARLDQLHITITLENGSLHHPDQTDAQIVSFNRYKINIPIKSPVSKKKKINHKNLDMQQLITKADLFGRETKIGKKLILEFHKRMVLPAGCIILALIGLPLGLQAGPGKRGIGIPLGLAVFISYYVLFTLGKMLSTDTDTPIALAMWMPNLFYLVFTGILIWRTANEQPIFPKDLTNIYLKLKEKITILFKSAKLKTHKRVTSYDKITVHFFRKKSVIKANAQNRTFHLPECESYNCKNCSIEFKNIEVALAANFSPCEFCKTIMPDKIYKQDDLV